MTVILLFFKKNDLKYAHNKRQKTKVFPFDPECKTLPKKNLMIIWIKLNQKIIYHIKKSFVTGQIKRSHWLFIGCWSFMLDMEWLLIKFMRWFHLNKVMVGKTNKFWNSKKKSSIKWFWKRFL